MKFPSAKIPQNSSGLARCDEFLAPVELIESNCSINEEPSRGASENKARAS